ncbi:MAG: Crp/Fnr family transcriptional regulator [Halarsenatibacteraceae bacterium]
MLDCVQGLNIFEVLSQEQVDEIASNAKVINVEAGKILFTPDDVVEVIYILHQGRIKIYKLNEAGRQLTLSYLVPGNIIGEVDIFSMRPRGVFAEVIEDALLCVIDKNYIREIMLKYPDLTEKILQLICTRVKDLEDDIYSQAICNTRDKLIKKLLQLANIMDKDEKEEVTLKLTHQELSEMIGSTRETVSLTLKTLDNSGDIITGHGKIKFKIEDLNKIKNYSC